MLVGDQEINLQLVLRMILQFQLYSLITDIENLTHKTGNYKQFDVFVAMLQSGLLKVIIKLILYTTL